MSAYQEAFDWITKYPGTGSCYGLAKLMLSLYNGRDFPFAFADCVRALDDERSDIAGRMAMEYAAHGETQELRILGKNVHDLYPHFWELGAAANDAMDDLRAKWTREREEAEGND